jgi:FAD/FMN-containing dehydrogenase
MKSVRVDPSRRTARAEPGLTWGEFDRETQAFGLATTGGIVSTTGIAGLTLGGGFGWLVRKYGLTCDNVLSFDMVTAEGRLVTASANENTDLFWGLRGGSGNFGVVTSFEYQLHPIGPTVLAGMVLHPLEKAKEVLRFYRSFIDTGVPDELTVHSFMLTAPDGNLVIAIVLCYNGDIETGEKVVQPIREFGPPLADLIGPMPYTAVNSMLDASFAPGNHYYWKAHFLKELNDECIDIMADHFATVASPLTAVGVELIGGAVARVSKDATAFSHRDGAYDFLILSSWTDPGESDQHIRWTRELLQKIQPFSTGGVYVNVMTDDEEVDRIQSAYGSGYQRLVSLKNKYDPTNFFRLNQNIPPSE